MEQRIVRMSKKRWAKRLLPFYLFTFLHHRAPCCAEDEGDDVTDRLKDRLYRLVHNFLMF